MKFVYIYSVILGKLEAFQTKRASVLCFRKMWMQLNVYEIENFSYSSLHHIFESENLGKLKRKSA